MSNLSLETLEKYASVRPSPFLKWAGGKGQLVQTIEKFYPASFGTYFEPFLGGGAVFFDLVSKGRIAKAVISDLNKDLINCYVAVRDQLRPLLTRLLELQKHARDKSFYYRVARTRFNETRLQTGVEGDIEKAALLFYLNKTCYNGLYRVNKKGGFNVPWGRYKNPSIFDEKNIRAVHNVLARSGVDIRCDDCRATTKNARAEDFIYFDPPYQPVSSTANFTEYTTQSFGWEDQERLAETFRELDERGCLLMLSNSPRVEKLYAKSHYRIERVKASRAISCIGSKRGPVDELLIMNY
jgi:DNA adenine methylase